MAVRLDKCIFEILVKLGAAELQALCEFMQTKIGKIENELFKYAAYAGTAAEQARQVRVIIEIAEGFLKGQTAFTPLLNIATGLAPDCPEISLVFQGAMGAGTFTKASLDTLNYIDRQLKFAQDSAAIIQAALEDSIVALASLCEIIQELIAQAAFSDKVDNFLGSKFKNINDYIDSKLPKGQIVVKLP